MTRHSTPLFVRLGVIAVLGFSLGVLSTRGAAASKAPADPTLVGEEKAILTNAPDVPPPIRRSHATKVVVELEVERW
jgi:hypothetical protein